MKVVGLLVLMAAGLPAQETFAGSADLDRAIEEAIEQDQAPGAVALVWSEGKILHRRAYGNRVLVPAKEPMTVDTIFDAASLTKVVATTASVMKLFEQGKIRLSEKVSDYLPGFQNGNSNITIRHLLTHFSGLRPDLDLVPVWSGYELGIKKALMDKPVMKPGERFIYSDINFILLGEIVRKLSGKPLPEFARETVFEPLGMKDTMFQPPASLRSRIAPTEHYRGMNGPLRGVVHDETTRFMGGIAGHAGLFTTAEDLSRFAEMILNGGEFRGKRIFSPLTVRKFTEPQTPPDQTILRGLGFDMDSQFSSNRGELFPIGSFGHTGFTGTSLWMDPLTKTAVILMTNSVHPRRRLAVSPLRARVATITAAAMGIDVQGVTLTGYNETYNGSGARRAVGRVANVMTGIDVLAAKGFAPLKGKRVGLYTNHTGLTRDGKRNIDAMVAGKVNLVAIFAPEHGISGTEDHEEVADDKDKATGVPIISLYRGKLRTPTPEMLAKIDVLVFDIQDVGARFYTYTCSLLNALEAVAKSGTPIMVLDRPNPITGAYVEGPMLDKEVESFVGCFPMPLRHGMTIGEMAKMFVGEKQLAAKLEVVPMRGWQRGDWFDSTGLYWVNLSPNMRSLVAATLYPGIAMIEYSRNYSVGRGTQTPFEVVGADWINGRELANQLNGRGIPGIRVYPTTFIPTESNLKGVICQGLRFVITDRERFDSIRFGVELIALLVKLYPGKIEVSKSEKLIGKRSIVAALQAGTEPRTIMAQMEEPLRAFLATRNRYLIYR